MIRIFEDDYPDRSKKLIKRLVMVMTILFVATIGISAIFIVYRQQLGSTLAMILGIVFSSIGFIIIFGILFEGVIPIIIKANMIARLTQNEARTIAGRVTHISRRPEFHLGEPYDKLTVETPQGMLDIYLWWRTKAVKPSLGASISVSLSENFMMGYKNI